MVPVPCHVDWNGMMRIDREGLVRFCDSCDKPVYDSQSMTRAQMRDLITRHEGPGRCMRLHVRPDGTIVTRDCFAPLLRLGRLLWLKTALLGMTFWAAAFGCAPWSSAFREPYRSPGCWRCAKCGSCRACLTPDHPRHSNRRRAG